MSQSNKVWWSIIILSVVVLWMIAVINYRFQFKWLNGSIHVATVKRYENGTDINYFLEIPIIPLTPKGTP